MARKAEFTRKVFGGTAGGPVVRGKLFWFADYQGGRQENPPADSFTTVIPDAWRNGDLSSLLPGIQLRDPDTGQNFVNNQIPVSRFSQFARNLLANEALYPRANVSRPMSDFRQNYVGKSASREKTNQFDIKVDWNASTNDKVYVRYSRQENQSTTEETAMPLLFGTLDDNPFWSVGANWNRIISRQHRQRPHRRLQREPVQRCAAGPARSRQPEQPVRVLAERRLFRASPKSAWATTCPTSARRVSPAR